MKQLIRAAIEIKIECLLVIQCNQKYLALNVARKAIFGLNAQMTQVVRLKEFQRVHLEAIIKMLILHQEELALNAVRKVTKQGTVLMKIQDLQGLTNKEIVMVQSNALNVGRKVICLETVLMMIKVVIVTLVEDP